MNKSPRLQAWEVLVKVFKQKAFSNILLADVSRQGWDLRSKNLIFALVHGTITWKIYLDYLTRKLIDPQKTPVEIQVLLWMSFYQLYFLKKIPNYAIVNEAVSIAQIVNPRFGGLVNACLKKAISQPNFLGVTTNHEEQRFCLEHAFPWELYQKITSEYGHEVAQKMVLDSIQKPNISLRVNTLKITSSDFEKQFTKEFGLTKTGVNDGLISEKPVVGTSIYHEGLVTIQDQASILVGQVVDPKPNTRVLDMCSAPGGKLTHLGALMKNSGQLVGYEISQSKITLIQENLQRLGVNNCQLFNGDALLINDVKKFDSILLDAPCSGFGVLKRKPEIKLNLNFSSLKHIENLQMQLLAVAYQNLKPNGFLTYSTCTINRQENQDQINKFLMSHPDLQKVFEEQLFGFENNTDGFYICKLQKKE